MDTTLADRYVLAVTRSVPEKQREDVAAELRASIADQVDARIEAGEPAADAERAVLEGLGDPDALAAGYADRPLYVIGPRYYLTWKRLLKLLLWIVPACAGFAIALGQTLSGAPLGEIIGSTAAGLIGVIVHLCFWVTVVFFVLDRAGVTDALTPWSLDQLPEPRENGARTSDMIASLVFLLLAAGAIVWDLFIGFVYLDGRWMSVLSPQFWPVGVLLLFAVIAAELVLAIVVWATGRWTMPLAIANTALAVSAASILLTALGRDALLNADAFGVAIASGASADLPQIVSTVVGFFVAGICVWDIVDGFLKAGRTGRPAASRR